MAPCVVDLLQGRSIYVSNAFAQLRLSFKQVRNNLEDARRHREDYFNRRTTNRAFRVGEQVLVKFPKIPIGVNPKFYKVWRGPYTVVKVLSRLNLKLQVGAYGKTIVVHVDRVKHCLLYTSPSPRDATLSRMPSSA